MVQVLVRVRTYTEMSCRSLLMIFVSSDTINQMRTASMTSSFRPTSTERCKLEEISTYRLEISEPTNFTTVG